MLKDKGVQEDGIYWLGIKRAQGSNWRKVQDNAAFHITEHHFVLTDHYDGEEEDYLKISIVSGMFTGTGAGSWFFAERKYYSSFFICEY